VDSFKNMLNDLKDPAKEYRPVPFWSWNDELDPQVLRWQIREMDKAGIGGYFMHARGGLKTEYLGKDWMECIRACIDEGKRSGMNSWAYDEAGWPSGFAGGIITAMGDAYHVRWLEMDRIEQYDDIKSDDKTLLGYYVFNAATGRVRHVEPIELAGIDGKDCEIICVRQLSNPYYVDILNKDVVKAFIDSTYEKYYSEFKDEFGDGLKGFFTDEPQFKRDKIPWSYVFPAEFKKRYGYDLIKVLPALFIACDGYEKVRYDFWGLVSDLYVNSYGRQIYEWCDRHNVQLTGHVMMEDSLFFQMTSTAGSMPFYEFMHVPGIDWLGRRIASPVTPKQVGSVAEQLGKKFVLTETYAMCGWDVSFEEMKWIAEWQYVNGVNLMCQHLESYTIKGFRKRDFPPSLFIQQSWWNEYKHFNDYLARLGVLLTSGKARADVLLLHPMKSAWVSYDGTNNKEIKALDDDFVHASCLLSGIHVDYHYGDETIIARHGSVEGSLFKVGRCAYRLVVMPSMLSLDSTTVDLLLEFAQNGGRIISIGTFPALCEGRQDERLKKLRDSVTELPAEREALYSCIKEVLTPEISISDASGEVENIHYQQRDLGKEQVFFLVNHSQHETYKTNVSINGSGVVKKYDAEINTLEQLDSVTEGGRTRVTLEFLPMQSHILVFSPYDEKNGAKRQQASDDAGTDKGEGACDTDVSAGVLEIEPSMEWTVERMGLNSLTLDRCFYSIDEGDWRGPEHVIKLMDILLELKRSCKIAMKFNFEIDMNLDNNGQMFLVSETIPEYSISINGKRLKAKVEGWWKDRAFHKVDIKDYVKNGLNEIVMEREFRQSPKVYEVLFGKDVLETERNKLTYDVELESIYITGDFCVMSKSGFTYGERKALFTDGPFVIVEKPVKVTEGDLTKQGFCFFAESIMLGQKLPIKRRQGQKVVLKLRKPITPMSKVYINGKQVKTLMWAPYTLDITDFVTDGENRVSIELFTGNRNLLGPHHNIDGESYYVRPLSFTDKKDRFEGKEIHNKLLNSYCFVRFGF